MTALTIEQMTELGHRIQKENVGATVVLTDFPSGGAMLDVRRADGRLFVMSYAPRQGFGVDEVQRDDGFVTGYRFVFSEFAPAADQFRDLVSPASRECPSCQDVNLNLVVVYARDMEAAKDFYSCLGMTFREEKHGSGPNHYAAELETTVFEIYPCRDETPPGGTRLGFRLASIDNVLNLLRQRNARIHSGPRDSSWGRRAVVEDPDGNKVELTQL